MSDATVTFTFPAAVAPFGATVYNALGQVVGRVGLVVSGATCSGSISLPEAPSGAYHARSESFDGDVAGLVLDDASIAAGGGTIGAATVVVSLQASPAVDITTPHVVTFDSDGIMEGAATFDGNTILIEPGLYVVDLEIDFTEPTTDRFPVDVTLFSNSGTYSRNPCVVSGGEGTAGYSKLLTGIVLVTSEGVTLTVGRGSGGSQTDDLHLEYAYASFVKLS